LPFAWAKKIPMAEKNLIEAVNMALAHELERDESVVVLGEDVGANGGVFRATAGLQQRFGPDRVIDTPLAETAIAGVAVGMAAAGLKPVAEIQFTGFIYPTFDHMVNHASRLRHRTRGRLTCPMVLRSPCGAGIHAPEHHSESPESLFAHVPGLRMVVASNPLRLDGERPADERPRKAARHHLGDDAFRVYCAHGFFSAHTATAHAASGLVELFGVPPFVPRMAGCNGALARRDVAGLDRADAQIPARACAAESERAGESARSARRNAQGVGAAAGFDSGDAVAAD